MGNSGLSGQWLSTSVKDVLRSHSFILQVYKFKIFCFKKRLYLCVSVYMCVWTPEEGVKCLPILLSAYYFKVRSLWAWGSFFSKLGWKPPSPSNPLWLLPWLKQGLQACMESNVSSSLVKVLSLEFSNTTPLPTGPHCPQVPCHLWVQRPRLEKHCYRGLSIEIGILPTPKSYLAGLHTGTCVREEGPQKNCSQWKDGPACSDLKWRWGPWTRSPARDLPSSPTGWTCDIHTFPVPGLQLF